MKITVRLTLSAIILLGSFSNLLSQEQPITVSYEYNDDNSIDINYTKDIPGSYYIKITFDRLENTNENSVVERVVNMTSGTLITLKPVNTDQGVGMGYHWTYMLGNHKAKVDRDFSYILPFKLGEKIKVHRTKTFVNEYSDKKQVNTQGDADKYFFAVSQQKADTVFCMRKGQVIEIQDSYESNANVKKVLTDRRNLIMVEHEDGTLATYQGFDGRFIFPELGQIVYPQMPLGVLEEFYNGDYVLSFSVSYLSSVEASYDDADFKEENMSPYASIPLYFYTDKGSYQIIDNNEYEVCCTEELLTKEFTRRERKKYAKEPEVFFKVN